MEFRLPRTSMFALAIAIACSSTDTFDPAASDLEIQPPAADVFAGDSVRFQALADGDIATVTWSVMEPGGGTIDADGNYVAPEAEGTFHVLAFVDDQSDPASAVVHVTGRPGTDAIWVAIQPKAASIEAGESLALAASVAGTSDTSVIWSVEEGAAGGTVTSAGVYTAPRTPGTYHVVAQSSADPRQSDRATVTVRAPSSTPAGPQFFVATDGSDSNPGTAAQPWRTIQKAMNSATPGSTVNIRGGTYHERLTMNVQGTAGNHITFQPDGFRVPASDCGGHTGVPCGGEQVFLDYAYLGLNLDTTPLLLISNKSYVRIQGLTFQNFTCNGPMQQMVRIDGTSSHVEFKYNKIRDSMTIGPWDGTTALMPFRVWGPANNIWVYGNEWTDLIQSYGESCTVDIGAHHVTVENNFIHHVDAIGIDVQRGANNYVVRGNRLEWISKRADGSWWYNNPAIAIYNDGGHTGVIERNYVSDAGVGYEALSETSYPAHDVTIRDNIAARCLHGIVVGTWYSDTDGSSVWNVNVLNNTFYGNSNGIVIRPMVSSTVNWTSNIFADNGSNYTNTLGWNPGNANYNLYWGGNAGPDQQKVISDPQFDNPSAGVFTIRSTSPAINAGDPNASTTRAGTVDFAGAPRIGSGRIDIGAYEAQ